MQCLSVNVGTVIDCNEQKVAIAKFENWLLVVKVSGINNVISFSFLSFGIDKTSFLLVNSEIQTFQGAKNV